MDLRFVTTLVDPANAFDGCIDPLSRFDVAASTTAGVSKQGALVGSDVPRAGGHPPVMRAIKHLNPAIEFALLGQPPTLIHDAAGLPHGEALFSGRRFYISQDLAVALLIG